MRVAGLIFPKPIISFNLCKPETIRYPSPTQSCWESRILYLPKPQSVQLQKDLQEVQKLRWIAHLAHGFRKKHESENRDNFSDAYTELLRWQSRPSVGQQSLEFLVFQSRKYLKLEEMQRKWEKAAGDGSGEWHRSPKWSCRRWHIRDVQ